jgi:Condensation domain/TubC N-terminal docking domain
LSFELQPTEPGSLDSPSSLDLQQLSGSMFLLLLGRKNIHLRAREGRLVVDAPAGVLDDTLRNEIKRRKTDLLAVLGTPEDASGEPSFLPARRGGRIPITSSQQGMWLIDHFDPGNVSYNIPTAFRIDFSLDIERLQKSIDLLIARHEILRTSFHEEEGELFQTIAPSANTLVGATDLTSLPEEEADKQARTLIRDHARQLFDLRQPPLLRCHCFRITPTRDLLFLNIHHIIADLQSLSILREELAVCYQSISTNRGPDLPVLSLQYADYASWAVAQLGSSSVANQLQYWKQKFAGLPPYLELPVKRPYPEQRSAWGATVTFEVSSATSRSLVGVGRESGATPFMTFLAAYALLIARFSGQRDFCIGSPVTQRKQVETQRMLGLFVNMVAYRMQIEPQQSFRDILRQVRTTALDAYEQSDVPFQTLVRALKFNRRSPRSPIFQVMFGFEPFVPSDTSVPQIDTDPGTARYDLSLLLAELADGSHLASFEYRTDLFDQAEIAPLANQFVRLLQEVADNPDQVCFSLPPVEASASNLPTSVSASPALDGSRRSLLGRLSSVFSSRTRP